MYRVYGCLTQEHDLRLVLIAGLVCLLASWTALSLARHGADDRHKARVAWLLAAAVVAGCGIWATHFIAMLAFATGLPTGYDPWLTAVSVLIAIASAGSAFFIAVRAGAPYLWLAGSIIGAGISAMHFTGMAALQVPAFMEWDIRLAGAAALVGIGLASAAVRTALGGAGPARGAAGTLLLTLGICATHFTAMGALRLQPTPLLPIPGQQLSQWWLGLAVAGAAAVIFASATVGMVVDRHLANRAEREAVRLRTLVDATFEGIVIHAGGRVLDLNASFSALVGRGREDLLGCSLLDLFAPGCADQVRSWLTSDDMVVHEAEIVGAGGSRIPVELLGRRIDHDGQRARVVAVRDVSEQRSAQERIRHLAHHDVLTGLPNRALFREHLPRALARARRGEGVAVLCLEIDRFKSVNDTLGHPAGDALLRAVAERLQACVRETDLVARLGGDEFAIIQESASQPVDATALARRLVEALTAPFEIDGHQVVTGASVGIVLAGDGLNGADALLKCADLALYRAKADGRGSYRFFEAEMDSLMQARRSLELDLRRALAEKEFQVFYQPLVQAGGGGVCGFEALLRWRHPQRGLVSPALFIPVAEEIGLIGAIGEWVLRRACTDAVLWPGALKVAVNLSPAQFLRGRSLAADVAAALAASGLPAGRLELEITESVLLRDDEGVLATLHALRALGVRISMDDFGTGYSSLSYLRRFPFDKIKIDQSFVRGMSEHEDCSAIVRAVIGLGRSLGMAVNAEGVETAGQLDALRAEGCGEVQGYLFSQPRPVGDVIEMLGQHGNATLPPLPAAASPVAAELAAAE